MWMWTMRRECGSLRCGSILDFSLSHLWSHISFVLVSYGLLINNIF